VSLLVLLRHGQSQWNLENRFTGWEDVPLTEQGRTEARAAGARLSAEKITFDRCYTSNLQRAQETLKLALVELGASELPITRSEALNERHYGDLQGLDKGETATKYGDEQVLIWRRSFDVPPPGGESLKDTAARTLPWFEANVMEEVRDGRNILVAAHGNSLRAIVMELEKLTPEEILKVNIGTGIPLVYEIGANGSVTSKRILEA
jgi:2,3-bisphosphoglycerate-dependent phosphoglycerate mutase